MNNKIITNRIAELSQYESKWKPKFLRNLRLYTYSMNVSLDQIKDGNIIGYWNLMDNTSYTSSINENVIQSAIDSLTSQLASKNARPLITTVNGTYSEMQVAKQAQQYFDQLFDEQNVNRTVTEAFRDACIFGKGFVYIDSAKRKITRALPWQVVYRPSEETYGKVTRCYYKRKWYPTSLLPGYKGQEEYITLTDYFDIGLKVHATLYNDSIVSVEDYQSPAVPFVSLSYVSPVYGKDTTSVVDILYGIQMKLDELYGTISEAIRLNPAQTFLVPQGSDIKVTRLTNEVGQVLTYKPIEGVSSPVTAATPSFIADQYLQMVEQLKKDAYELVGISRLTAQSQKPQGLDSGVALKTMNDIESERFEVQYKNVIRAYTEVAKACILTFPSDEDILPADRTRANIRWSDIVNSMSRLKIQFSSMDYLSKDPSTKIQQINALVANGIIPQQYAAKYFDMPDIDSAYNFANNSLNAVQAVITDCLEKDDYTIPEYIPFALLKAEITNTILSLKAVDNEQNKLDIEKLKELYSEVVRNESLIVQQQSREAEKQDDAQWNKSLQRQVQQIQATQLAGAQAAVQIDDITQPTNSL